MEHPNRKIETFAEDMAEAIRENKGGLIQKIIHEEEKRDEEKKQYSPESPKNKRYFLFGTLILIVALAVFALAIFKKDSFIFDVAPRFNPLIFNDEFTLFEAKELTKEEIAQEAFKILAETQVEKGGILGIYPSSGNRVLELSQFLEKAESVFRPSRGNHVSENFMLGAFITVTKPPRPVNNMPPQAEGDLFFLLKTRSFQDAFDDMRAWEEQMFSDLHDFFRIEVNSETAHLLTKDFKDGVVENKNSRILYFDDGRIALMYIYADDTSIIITASPKAAEEVILRLAGSRVKK